MPFSPSFHHGAHHGARRTTAHFLNEGVSVRAHIVLYAKCAVVRRVRRGREHHR